MGPDGRSEEVRGRTLSYPFLLECDRNGRVLWMSDNTRAALGACASLVGTIPRWRSSGGTQEAPTELVYSQLLELGGTILVGARPVEPAEALPQESETALVRLQGKLLLHYFRLLAAERKLARRVGRRRRPGGVRALRQIELERERLARELHTSVGQLLSAIRLQAEVIAAHSQAEGPTQPALDRIFTLSAEALEQIRSVSKRLHPPEWQRLSLAAALEQLWDLSGIPQRFEASFHIGPLPREPELDIKILVYRVVQEAVSNLIRHSRATRVDLSVAERAAALVVTFRDNGMGFDAPRVFGAPPSVAGGIGLRSIRDQVEAVGGKFVVESGSNGTTLEVTVPFAPAES